MGPNNVHYEVLFINPRIVTVKLIQHYQENPAILDSINKCRCPTTKPTTARIIIETAVLRSRHRDDRPVLDGWFKQIKLPMTK